MIRSPRSSITFEKNAPKVARLSTFTLELMQIKRLRAVKILSLIIVSFIMGTIFGLREGGFAFYVIDAVPKGVISMSQIKAIEKCNLAPTKMFLNMEIDQGLYHYSIAKDQWWFPLFRMGVIGGTYSESTEYVTRLAKYRKLIPNPNEDPTIFDKVPKGKEEYVNEYVEMAAAHRDRITRIKAVVDEYSAK